MMSNSDVKQMIDTFGKRICGISLNNGKMLFLDYRGVGSTKLEEISFETIGGCDMMVISKTDISHGRHIHYKNYIVTEFIESVIVMDEDSENERVDPMLLK